MDLANSNDPLNTLNSLLIFLQDSSDNEEDVNYSMLLTLLTEESNNKNAGASRRKKRANHVSVQTDSAIVETDVSWMWEAERKIDEFCAHLSNLENTLYHARNRVIKTKNKVFSSSIPTSTHSGKLHLPSSNLKNFGCTKMPAAGSENLEDSLMLELIDHRLNSTLRSALDLRNSVPKVDGERLHNVSQREYQVVESTTVKETNILRLERSKSSVCRTTSLLPHVFKREGTLPTVNESKFRHPSQMTSGIAKFGSKCAVAKTKNVVKAQNSAPGTSRQPSEAQGRDMQFQDSDVPTRDTGAIPKTRVRSTNVTIRTHKTKKTDFKPLWK